MQKRYLFIGIGLVLFFSVLTYSLHNRPLGQFKNIVPMYPGATIQSSMNFKDGSQIVFTTKDDSKKIFNFFKNELARNGWIVYLERYGKDIVLDQNGKSPFVEKMATENTAFIALYKENMGLMIDTDLIEEKTDATLYIGHTLE